MCLTSTALTRATVESIQPTVVWRVVRFPDSPLSPTLNNHTFQFAFCIWMAGTLGTVAGTLVYPARGPELLSILAEMGASALLT